jgi:hypothetical protein
MKRVERAKAVTFGDHGRPLDQSVVHVHGQRLVAPLRELTACSLETAAAQPAGDSGTYLHVDDLQGDDLARSSPQRPHLARPRLRDQQLDESRCVGVEPQ